MDLSQLTEYISPIILVACTGIGYIFHSLNNKILNKFIPTILGILGIIIAVWSLQTFNLPTIVTGLISGLASCGLYEAFKNILKLPEMYAEDNIVISYADSDTSEFSGKHFKK